jgi:exodeoxyribonuclease VII large subunit
MPRRLERAEDRLAALSRALTTLNPKTPKPGFARIEDAKGAMIASAAALSPGQAVRIVFSDGAKDATIDGEGGAPRIVPAPKPAPRPKAAPAGQGDLF